MDLFYTYTDRSVKTYHGNGMWGDVVFVCIASSISEADALYTAATGNNPIKQPHVGVAIEKIK